MLKTIPQPASTAAYGSTQWCEERFQEAEDDPWGLGWRSYEQERYRFTASLLQKYCAQSFLGASTPIKALDLGCATGHFTCRLKALADTIVGIDASETAVARARHQCPDITFLQADSPGGALANAPFHVMACLEMLYYLPRKELKGFLATMTSMLHPGGVAIFSVLAGPMPYFSREELVQFLGSRFQVVSCTGFGCRWYARLEKVLFDTYKRLGLLKNALLTQRQPNENQVTTVEPRSRFQRLIHRMRSMAADHPRTSRAMGLGLHAGQWLLRSLLSWRPLARFGLVLGRARKGRGTHWIAVCIRADV
jgi:SAM-dependent methyltransferase